MYADTDFFLALLKDDDWLKQRALRLLNHYRNELVTSVATVVELLLLCKRMDMDPEELLACVYELARIDGITEEQALRAAHYMKEYRFTALDALHASFCGGAIISSDHAYDRIGLTRIRLEA
ncbi:PIN domain-containing protein [Candidatus Woesearchaeota archaeon]|nr:PIN domain-containing protein [Candidatus Woesearchaeota archaeon]